MERTFISELFFFVKMPPALPYIYATLEKTQETGEKKPVFVRW